MNVYQESLKRKKSLTKDQKIAKMKQKSSVSESLEVNFNFALRAYRILRIKMKISYMAWQQKITILELFLKSISKTYVQLHRPVPQIDFEQNFYETPLF